MKWSFFLCVGENQGHISKCIPCPKWHSARSYLHMLKVIQWSPLFPNHTDYSNCVWSLGLCVTVHWGLRKHQRCYPIP